MKETPSTTELLLKLPKISPSVGETRDKYYTPPRIRYDSSPVRPRRLCMVPLSEGTIVTTLFTSEEEREGHRPCVENPTFYKPWTLLYNSVQSFLTETQTRKGKLKSFSTHF